jgi:multidrug efflux pump subunit AcrA (membrane-fusion protein)
VGSADTPAVTAAVNPTPRSTSRSTQQTATVKKDSIVATLSLDGIVAAPEQATVMFSTRGTVSDVKVKSGQAVSAGDEILEVDSADLSRSLDAARARLQTSQAALAQAQQQEVSRQQQAAQQAATAQAQRQQAIADAQAGVRKAQENMATVMAGASPSDRRTAETTVNAAQTALQKALDAQSTLMNGPDAATLRSAQNDLVNAQIAAQRAQSDYDTLVKGADPVILDQAQRAVDRAQADLQIAKASPLDPKAPDPKLAHDNAVADAQLAVQVAQDKLAKLKQPPQAVDVQAAKLKVQSAQDAVNAATDKLNNLSQPPDDASLAAAQAAVDSAQQGVADAQARLNAVNALPTPAQVADAQDQIRRAQAALDSARNNPNARTADSSGPDLGALQQQVDSDSADIASIQQQIDSTRMLAPFDGTTVSIRAKTGDAVTSSKPVTVIIAKPGTALVRAQLDDGQVSSLAVGQSAQVVLGGTSASDTPVIATVTSVTPAAKDGSSFASANFAVQWPDTGAPKLGLPVGVNVTVQEKDDVLVLPIKAVRQTGDKQYVEVLDGNLRRLTNVQLGIRSADSVEVVSGLKEGQVVLLAS